MYEICVEDYFAGAHNLREYQGKCEKLHGHNYRVQVFLRGEKLDKIGLAIDFGVVKKWLKEVLDILDHQYINEILPFDKINPSAENVAQYIFQKMNDLASKNTDGYRVYKITVWETDKNAVSYMKTDSN